MDSLDAGEAVKNILEVIGEETKSLSIKTFFRISVSPSVSLSEHKGFSEYQLSVHQSVCPNISYKYS